ncbi:MAG: DUF4214 domain-containing protein, partial [Rhizobiales bacterium]|nr:DUF4214 domain-containing protein [Hyphomicrobiales bacterium]
DLDGDGDTDAKTVHQIAVNADKSRIETVTVSNGDNSLRGKDVMSVSADGKSKTTTHDRDGNTVVDLSEVTLITVNADGTTDSTVTVKNGDNSVRGVTTVHQSADAMAKTEYFDINGDGTVDQSRDSATTLNAGARTETVTVYNGNYVQGGTNSIHYAETTTLGADKITYTKKVDLGRNGTFNALDLIDSVSVDATTHVVTASHWDRNFNGSVIASTVKTTSADGLSVTTASDANGDSVTDTTVTDITVYNADFSSDRTITTTNNDLSLRQKVAVHVNANGLSTTTQDDVNADGTYDYATTDSKAIGIGGSWTRTIAERATDNTLLSQTVETESSDRLSHMIATDANGDTKTDTSYSSVTQANGDVVETTQIFNVTTLVDKTLKTTTGNGLSITTQNDANGDGVYDTTSTDTTVLNSDGSRTETVTVSNGDGSLRAKAVITVNDDGLVRTTQSDANGDLTFERKITDTTVLNSDGSTTETMVTTSASNATLGQSQIIVSDDGLTVTTKTDVDGNGTYDFTTTDTTIVNSDGSKVETIATRDAANVLRGQTVTTSNDNASIITINRDSNGDGNDDQVETIAVWSSGPTADTVINRAANAVKQSHYQTLTSADHLSVTTNVDLNGDVVFDYITTDVTVLNTNGSATETISETSNNGALIFRTITVKADDGLATTALDNGLSTTTTRDLNGDGTVDLTTVNSHAINANGSQTDTIIDSAANGTTRDKWVISTSADKRHVTTTFDADGNGQLDRQTNRDVADNGTATIVDQYFSIAGTLIGKSVTTVSADGLTGTVQNDRNADGRYDTTRNDTTVLQSDGSSERTIADYDRNFVLKDKLVATVSDNGLSKTTAIDSDGDGVFNFVTVDLTDLRNNGSSERSVDTRDGSNVLLNQLTTTTSGNGLVRTSALDVNGDGGIDRSDSFVGNADGSSVETIGYYGTTTTLSYYLRQEDVVSTSADGRTISLQRDTDGNGIYDRFKTSVIDLSHNLIETSWDTENDGTVEHRFIVTTAANGLTSSVTLDLDGDGQTEIARTSTTSIDASGNRATVMSETYGSGSTLGFRETTTAAANGYHTVVQTDIDGNGTIDKTRTVDTQLAADGSQTTTAMTLYADGSLRAKTNGTVSADGRTTKTTMDMDGNGVIDHSDTSVASSDGKQVETMVIYNQAGFETSRVTATTSADGLTTNFDRSGFAGDAGTTARESIKRSALSDAAYSWDNGIAASTTSSHLTSIHAVDGAGIDSWTLTVTYLTGTTPPYTTVTNSYSARLDDAGKARMLAAAERIYDAVLDRDLARSETESLIQYAQANGELNKSALVSALLASSEFTTKYATMSNGEFVTTIYENALGRAPTMAELDKDLAGLSAGTMTQTSLALALAESSEHLLAGNGHLSSNNVDLDLAPAVFDRIIDQSLASAMVGRLVDVVYDRDATAQELAVLSQKLLTGTDRPDNLASLLLSASGDMQGVSTASLAGLSGSALVQKAYLNALGRLPTVDELATWTANLSSGKLTTAQFIASLAESPDHLANGNDHWPNTIVTPTTYTGGSGNDVLTGAAAQNILNGNGGNDTLTGSTGSDKLVGGTGNDSLVGGNGNDRYEWSKTEGLDTITDNGTPLTETDTLALLNVASTDVTLTEIGSNLKVLINSTNEYIMVSNQFVNASYGYGIEAISFNNGVTWSLRDILAHTSMTGASLTGTGYDENLLGTTGNDTLSGAAGDDRLVGGTGSDTLDGGAGNDRYEWSIGDGGTTGDTINDTGTSLTEIDTLALLNVASTGVTLTMTGADLLIKVSETNNVTETITVKSRYTTAVNGTGVEVISFSDGVIWNLADIISHTTLVGTTGADNLTGPNYADTISGDAGADTLTGGIGDDRIIGGGGDDTLQGGIGSDRYEWSAGDGKDLINDGSVRLSETDTLALLGIASSTVTLMESGNNLVVTVSGTAGGTITIQNQFISPLDGYGIEAISFGDGVNWNLQDILDHATLTGSGTLNGSSFDDNIYGSSGADTLNGNGGNDKLVGGAGNDLLQGGDGSDLYQWSKGDGSDTITDHGSSLADVDTLALLNATSAEATLSKAANGLDLVVTVAGGSGGSITVTNRFDASVNGDGVEYITYSDGVRTQILDSPVAEITTTGTSVANTLSGWSYIDNLYGLDGNDTLNGNGGDDLLVGGNGTDALLGGTGSDTYQWSRGAGADTISDNATSLTQIDTLLLTDVASADVALTESGTSLIVSITNGTGLASLTVTNRYYSTSYGYGIEAISFSDGVTWSLQDILDHTTLSGTGTVYGSNYDDNIVGGATNDTIYGYLGDDRLVAGQGNDTLYGGTGNAEHFNGNDRYEWSTGDGNDTIIDNSTSLTETDTLALLNVASTGAILTETGYNLTITIGNEQIVVINRFDTPSWGYGIEAISFGDGVTWSLQDILDHTTLTGSGTVNGSSYEDNIIGSTGADTLNGNDGNDRLTGGTGVDLLQGGSGSDSYMWATGDGRDTITDTSISLTETDSLVFTNVASTEVVLTETGYNLTITIGNEQIVVTNQFYNPSYGYGIERIEFNDGVAWTLEDIFSHTKFNGTSGADAMTGTTFNENFYGFAGNDTINGSAGDDKLVGDADADTLNGGTGIDTVSYETATQAVKVDLSVTTGQTGNAGGDEVGDVISNVENLQGSDYSDWLSGDNNSNEIWGGLFNDTIYGLDGYDQLHGDDGADTLEGGASADYIDGGAGPDTASYYTSAAGVTVNLLTGLTAGGDAEGDVLVSIERLKGSSTGNDTLTGNAGANKLWGYGGNDSLDGGNGADILEGGAGSDILIGGLGSDTFNFATGFGLDTVTDFNPGTGVDDVISLSLGTAFDTYAEVMAVATQVGADTVITIDATDKITLIGVLKTALVADDFAFY